MYTVYFEVWNLFVTRFYDQLVHWFCATLCHSTPSMEKKQSQVQMKKLSNGSWAIERGFSQLHLTWMQVMASASTYLQLFFLLATLLQHIDDMLKWWTHFTFGAKLCKTCNFTQCWNDSFLSQIIFACRDIWNLFGSKI